jgi:ABC-type glycerol-3-phosphate transport system substrate-binding protein
LTVLVTSVLAGCKQDAGGNTSVPPEDQTVITFTYPEYLTYFAKASYQPLADAFNAENPDLRVELREISTDELMEKGGDYQELILDPQLGVDVFLSRSQQSLLGNAHLLDLEPLVAPYLEFELDDFYPFALDTLSQEGSLWGLPGEMELVVIYYNKELFDQAGVPYPAVSWTRDDFLDAAVALRQGLPEREMAFAGQVSDLIPFIYAHGGAIKEGSGYTLTAARTVEAVRWFADLALAYGAVPFPAQLELYEPEPREGVMSSITTTGGGEASKAELRWGMIGAKTGLAADFGDTALWAGELSARGGSQLPWDFDWGIVPWPRDQKKVVLGRAYAYFVSANTPHPQAALRWINFLTRQPPQLKGIPARRSVAASEQVHQAFENQIGVEAYDACLQAIEEATPVDYFLYRSADLYLGQALLDILENGADVETALAGAQAALEAGR